MKFLLKLWMSPLAILLLILVIPMTIFGYEKPFDDLVEMFES